MPNVIKRVQLPPQMKDEDVQGVQVSNEVFKQSASFGMIIDYLLQMMLAGSLAKLWNLFCELQVVEHLDLFLLKTPGSWNTFAD